MNKDKSGWIDAQELAQAMKINKSITIPDEQIDKIMNQVSFYGSGKIYYSEFLAATIKVKKVLNEARLWTLFKNFDIDDTGLISENNLKEAFEHFGIVVSNSEIEDVIKKHGKKTTDKIDFSEFKKLLMDEEQVKEVKDLELPN